MNSRKITAKVLSVFMSLLMLFSVCAPLVAATGNHEHEDLHYVSIGDSMTNGYGFDGYEQSSDDDDVYDFLNGKNVYGTGSYADLFADHIGATKHTQLALSAMTSRDLLYLLGGCDEAVTDDDWHGYLTYIGNYTPEQVQAYFIENVKDADIISLCIGNANFGAFLMHKLTDIIGLFVDEAEAPNVDLELALAVVENEALKKMVEDLYERLVAEVLPYLEETKEIGAEKGQWIIDLLVYTVAGYIADYNDILNQIVELNPDVEIVLIGLINPLADITISIEGEEEPLPFGEIMGLVYETVNAYIAGLPALRQLTGDLDYVDNKFYYVEQPELEYIYEVFDDLAANGWRDFEGVSGEIVRDRTLSVYNDAIVPMLAEAFKEYGFTAKAMKLELIDLVKYESGLGVDWNGRFQSVSIPDMFLDMKLLSVMIYLGIEAGLVKSVETTDISLDGILTLADPNGLGSIFATLGAKVGAVLSEEAIAKICQNYAEAHLAYTKARSAFNRAVDENKPISEINELKEKLLKAEQAQAEALAAFDACSVENVAAIFSDYFTSEEILPLCKIFTLFKVGDGLAIHPTVVGHKAMAEAVINAYETNHTVFKQTLRNVKTLGGIFGGLFLEYYEEIYEYAYNEAVKQGWIDEINDYLDVATEAIDFAEAWANGYKDYFRGEDFAAQITVTADNAKETIEALRELINNADYLDAETYAYAAELLAKLEANVADLAELIKIAAEDAIEYATPIVEAELAKFKAELQAALAVLNAKVNTVLEQIAAVDAQIRATIEAVEAYIEAFLSNSAFEAEYHVSADSYYVAIGADTLYAEKLANKMGLGADQFTTVNWNDVDSALIAKADLITISYSESMLSGFVVDQMYGYIKNYIDEDLRASVNAYVEAAIEQVMAEIPGIKEGAVDAIIENVAATLNGKLDEALANDFVADITFENMDWAALVGEENAQYVEEAVAAVKDAIAETGVSDMLAAALAEVIDQLPVDTDKLAIVPATTPGTIALEVEVIDILVKEIVNASPLFAYLDTDDIKAMLGDYATYTVEVPVVDFAVCAVESYVYAYVKYNVELSKLLYAINAINPDAQVVVLGGYNVFGNLGLDATIPGFEVELDQFFTPEVQEKLNYYGEKLAAKIIAKLEVVTSDRVVDAVMNRLTAYLEKALNKIYAVQDKIGAFELVEIIKNFDIPEVELADLVGAENVVYAKKLIASIKFILTEADVYDAIVSEIPTAADIVALLNKVDSKIDGAFDKLDAVAFEALLKTVDGLEAFRAILDSLSDYVAALEATVPSIQDFCNDVYEWIAEQIIVVDEQTIDLGELFGDVVSGSISAHSLAYAFIYKNVIYVDISEVESVYGAGSYEEFFLAYLFDQSIANISEEGHALIAEKLFAALNVVCDHNDANNDHVCDYCGETVSECVDADKDHKCDICGKTLSECADKNNDHKCDLCNKVLSECADKNNDHKCDVCNKVLSECADKNNDHKCDTCDKVLTPCEDKNNDHKCDTCDKVLTPCEDKNNDHNCDVCGKVLSECKDENKDHKCDICGKTVSECVDADDDRFCDICGAELRKGLSTGAIVAIVAGSVVVVAAAGFAVWFFAFGGKAVLLKKKN